MNCQCTVTADCPGGYGCGGGACYPRGSFPQGVECTINDDCVGDLICQQTLGTCTTTCKYGSADTCGSGYICHSNSECLPYYSLTLGSGCFNDLLCPLGSTCIGEGRAFLCGIRCTEAYGTSECPEDRYCLVALAPKCTLSTNQCTPGTTIGCATPRICIDLGGGINVCRKPCTYSLDTSGIYSDSCSGQVGSFPAACAPLGVSDLGVCIEANASGGSNGAACTATSLCRPGNVCENSICRLLCDTSPNCGSLSCQSIGGDFKACLP